MEVTREQYKQALTQMLSAYRRMNKKELSREAARDICKIYIPVFNDYQKQVAKDKARKFGVKSVPVFKTDFVNMRRDYDKLVFAEGIVK